MKNSRAFTLIELLVVVAVIAVLIAILLPSLGKARSNARAVACGASVRAISQGVASYLAENSDTYPPSYVYPDASGSWNTQNQIHPPANGYLHWSSFLIGYAKDVKAFTCPEFERGGVPRTNPGPNPSYWMDNQIDQNGNTGPNSAAQDQQVPFCAFTANEAIMPRNKFSTAARESDPSTAGGIRLSGFVRSANIKNQSSTILATEFNSNWKTIAQDQGGGYKALGHRSIMPFGLLASSNEFQVPLAAFYTNLDPASLMDKATIQSQTSANLCLIQDSVQLNAVGRNHPGSASAGGKSMGGTSNFLYVDGHVDRKSVVDTLNNREWGAEFYTMHGAVQ
ncbi:MAG TPA: prepilin-type N-terminal cleavage/methylation domain-containing protein [Phycisphaerae bacterium]